MGMELCPLQAFQLLLKIPQSWFILPCTPSSGLAPPCQAVCSFVVSVLFYFVPPSRRDDVVTETCYPSVFMLLFFRVLTAPTAKVSFYYNFYVNTVAVGLYSVVGTNDLYLGLVGRPKPHNIYLHYGRLYLMLLTCFLIVGDVLYTEFFEHNVRILPEKKSVGDAMRAKVEAAVKKYNEDLAKVDKKKEKSDTEDLKKPDKAADAAPSPKAGPGVVVIESSEEEVSKKPQRWF